MARYAQLMYEEFRVILEANSSDPIKFTRESCIKLNNLLGAQQKLKEVLVKLDVDTETRINPSSKRTEPTPGISSYHITIIRATNLLAQDWYASDPYCVLKYKTDELERTKVIPKNLSPVWNEQFNIKLPHAVPNNESFLGLMVYDKDFIKDDLCGSAELFMRDRLFEDYLSHDVEVALNPQGTLHVRVAKEGEIEDRYDCDYL
jgi:Ca2+-dependent lipid-binding protein